MNLSDLRAGQKITAYFGSRDITSVAKKITIDCQKDLLTEEEAPTGHGLIDFLR